MSKIADEIVSSLTTFSQTLKGVSDLWQPIETAPKDGNYILTFSRLGMNVSRWWLSFQRFMPMDRFDIEPPSHWMPLPPPPEVGQ